jgi:hypothetical protein
MGSAGLGMQLAWSHSAFGSGRQLGTSDQATCCIITEVVSPTAFCHACLSPQVYYVLNTPPAEWKMGAGFITADMIKDQFAPPGPDTLTLR